MPMSNAVPCFYCGHKPVQTPYGKAVHVGCGNHKCTGANGSAERNLDLTVKTWNKEQKRLAEAHG
jgi:hypothetical protein